MSTVRSLVFSAITGSSALNTLGINSNTCWAAGSFDGPKDGPFMILRWGPVAKGIGPVNSSTLIMYVHDKGAADYSRINAILLAVRTVLLGLSATGPAINWINDVAWLGDGGELNDPLYGTLVRSGEFRVTANTL